MTDPIVIAEGLHKSFGDTQALRGLDLSVPKGTVCGVLGPNGAGKTTAVRILATLSDPDAGHARIAGYDVVREAGQVHQRVLSTIGRLDVLQATGQIEGLMRSGLRFCQKMAVIDAHAAGQTEPVAVQRVGPDLVFGRLWENLQLPAILERVLESRRYEFDVERAIYLTVLHRLFASGSDRAAAIGWGPGLYARGLAQHAATVTCVDASAAMLAQIPADERLVSVTASVGSSRLKPRAPKRANLRSETGSM